MLKGCATPGFDVAAGAPEAERGVAVVEVSAVMGVEDREGVVLKVRAKEGAVRRERRVRQRVQIMVVVMWLCGCCVDGGANGLPWLLAREVRDVESPKAEARARRRRSGRVVGHVMKLTSLLYQCYTMLLG